MERSFISIEGWQASYRLAEGAFSEGGDIFLGDGLAGRRSQRQVWRDFQESCRRGGALQEGAIV